MTIRTYQSGDFPAVQQYLRRHYTGTPLKADGRVFDWKFQRNPSGSSLDGYFLAVEDDAVIGQVATLRDRLWAGGQWHDMAWQVDFGVEPEHRASHAGLRLLRAAVESTPVLLAVGVCPGLAPIYSRLGFLRRPILHPYFSVFRPSGLLAAWDESGASGVVRVTRWSRSLFEALGQILPAVQGWYSRRADRPTRTVDPAQGFNAEIDELAERLLPRLGITTLRSSTQLSWKFLERPFGKQELLEVREESTGRLTGYAVVKFWSRPGARWAEIVDLLADPDDDASFLALLLSSHREALRKGADFVRFRCSRPEHLRLLRTPWWIHYRRPIIDELFISCRDESLRAELMSGTWHLTALASDQADHGGEEQVEVESCQLKTM